MTDPRRRLEGVRACVFDAYGTLFDFASAAARAADVPEDKRAALTALWRDRQLQYTCQCPAARRCVHKRAGRLVSPGNQA